MSKIPNKKLLFLVTGTTRGLGRAIAERVLHLGYNLIEINKSTVNRKHSFIANLSRPDEVIEILNDISELIKSKYNEYIVIFISNAATILPIRSIGFFEAPEIINISNINLISPILISNAIARLKNHSIIINITSGAADKNNRGLSLYSATKAGYNKFIEIAQIEKSDSVLHMHSYDPGVMDTEMQYILRSSKKYFDKACYFEKLKREGKLNQPKDVAIKITNYIENFLLKEHK